MWDTSLPARIGQNARKTAVKIKNYSLANRVILFFKGKTIFKVVEITLDE